MATAFADLADLPEDTRIEAIASAAESGELVGFVVEDDAKADRYVKKLVKFAVRIVDRKHFTLNGRDMVLVRVGPRGH
jgi:hypothetical protein